MKLGNELPLGTTIKQWLCKMTLSWESVYAMQLPWVGDWRVLTLNQHGATYAFCYYWKGFDAMCDAHATILLTWDLRFVRLEACAFITTCFGQHSWQRKLKWLSFKFAVPSFSTKTKYFWRWGHGFSTPEFARCWFSFESHWITGWSLLLLFGSMFIHLFFPLIQFFRDFQRTRNEDGKIKNNRNLFTTSIIISSFWRLISLPYLAARMNDASFSLLLALVQFGWYSLLTFNHLSLSSTRKILDSFSSKNVSRWKQSQFFLCAWKRKVIKRQQALIE